MAIEKWVVKDQQQVFLEKAIKLRSWTVIVVALTKKILVSRVFVKKRQLQIFLVNSMTLWLGHEHILKPAVEVVSATCIRFFA